MPGFLLSNVRKWEMKAATMNLRKNTFRCKRNALSVTQEELLCLKALPT